MTQIEIFEILNKNPVFHLATIEDDKPRVRGMLLYKADEKGILFHTGSMKEVYNQIIKNNNVELCFWSPEKGIQIRIRGEITIVNDITIKEEISNHPSRVFVKKWREDNVFKDFYKDFIVLKLVNGKVHTWTMAENFSDKNYIQL